MSWDKKQGPWGKEQRPPEIDELLKNVQDRVRNLFGGKRFPVIGLLVIVVVLLWLATGIYQVNQDQVGIVQRFGKYNRTVGPGLQWKLPSGLENVTRLPRSASTRRNSGCEPSGRGFVPSTHPRASTSVSR